ncbi:MAG: hypothetical protein M0Z76_05730 [Gammaproteobacteria bacterium]|nr:hypothetical protein [Gammaproteobacteria bacterium]
MDTLSEFPFLLVHYGGAAFVASYLLAAILVTWPLVAAQIALGRRRRQRALQGLSAGEAGRGARFLWNTVRAAAMIGGFLVFCYVAVFSGWIFSYIQALLAGAFKNAALSLVVAHFTRLTDTPAAGLEWETAFITPVFAVAAMGPAAIEEVSRFVVPALVALVIGLAAYGVSLDSFFVSAPLLITTHVSHPAPAAALTALSQAFLGAGLGTASFVAYGAYVPAHTRVLRLSWWFVVAAVVCVWLAGLAFASIAYGAGLPPLPGGGFVFETLPLASERLPLGHVVVGLCYLALVLAAWVSTLSWLEPLMQLGHSWGIGRARTAAALGLASLAIGGALILSLKSWAFSFTFLGQTKTLGLLDILMMLAVNLLLPWGGGGMAVFLGWHDERAVEGPRAWGRVIWLWSLRLVVPAAVLTVVLSAPRLIL